jgi:proline iminopeptidase
MPHLVSQLDQLRAALGPETVAMMQQHEAEGSLEHPEYQAAITILNYRHVCRLKEWPAPLMRSIEGWNHEIYGVMQGPNEFLYTGNLKDWNRVPDLPKIKAPVLIVNGEHDELTPACALRMKTAMPRAEVSIMRNSSHMPFYENPADYYRVLVDFLSRHGAGT